MNNSTEAEPRLNIRKGTANDMNKFEAVLFDFDGTVADTSPGIKKGLLYSFEVNGLPPLSYSEMDKFIGPPLSESFMNYCGVDPEKSRKMIKDFRKKYHSEGVNEFIIYDGLEKALNVLKRKNVIVALATSKPEDMAVHILKRAGLYEFFDVILGATLDEKLIQKSEIMSIVLNNPLIKGKRALMVGDTKFDIIGAHENKIPALWVKYGFGVKEETEAEKPEYIAENMNEMIEFFESF